MAYYTFNIHDEIVEEVDCSISFNQTSQAWKESQDIVMMMEDHKMEYEENISNNPHSSWPTPDLLMDALVANSLADISSEEFSLALESVMTPEAKDLELVEDFSELLIYPAPSSYTPSPVQSTDSNSSSNFFLPTLFHNNRKKHELDPRIKQQIDEKVKPRYIKYCEMKQGLQEFYFEHASDEKQFLIDLQRAITEMIQVILQKFGNGDKMRKELTAHLNYLGKYALLVTIQPSSIALCERKESQIAVVLLISPELISPLISNTNYNISVTLVNENKVKSAKIACNNEKSNSGLSPEFLELKKDSFGIGFFAKTSSWKIVVKKPKRIVKGAEKDSSVLDESFHLQFKCDVHLNGYGTFSLETYSFPFKILTNISQKDKAMKTIVWERAAGFFGHDIYKIHQKKQVHSLKFGKLVESIRILVEQETGRAVSKNDVVLIGNKFFGDEITLTNIDTALEANITLHDYRDSRKIFENGLSLELYMEKDASPKSPSNRKRTTSASSTNKGISFIDWFLLLTKFLKSDPEFLNLWQTGQMFSYLSKEQNLKIFSHSDVGTFIYRLSMSTPVSISIDWVVHKVVEGEIEKKTEVECLRWPRKDKDTSMSEHKLSALRNGFENTIWKNLKTWRESKEISNEEKQYINRTYVSKELRCFFEFV